MNPNVARPDRRAPLRVAHVVATSGATGVESYLMALLAGFDRARVVPVLFVPRDGPLVHSLEALGIAVELGAPKRKLAFGEARHLARRMRGSFDLVHAHGARGSFWAAVAAGQAGLPLVVTLHELRWRMMPRGPKRWLWLSLERWALGRSRRLIAVSADVRRSVLARYPEWAGRTRVVPGSSPQLLKARPTVPIEFSPATGPVRLITVGRLEPVKGIDRLLDALARLATDAPFTLDLVGQGPLEGALRKQAARLGIADRVRWHTAPADVPGLLDRAQIFVTATHEETQGLAVLEAMAAGRPVVAPAIGGLVELVGSAGILVEPGRDLARRLAEAIALLVADPQRAGRLSLEARERAIAMHDPFVLANRVTEIYEELTGVAS